MSHKVREHYGVRTERYKLIRYYTVNESELFDLQTDPREMKNVYGDPAYADTQKSLEAELKRLQAQYKDDHPDVTDKDLRPKPSGGN
jgi:arylsulfatase A-like enzyme